MSDRISEAERTDHQPAPPPPCLVSAFHRVFGTGEACGRGLTEPAIRSAGLLLCSIEADNIPLPRLHVAPDGTLLIRWAHEDRQVEASVAASGDVWLYWFERGRLSERFGRLSVGRSIEPLRRLIRRAFGARYGRHDAAAMNQSMETGT